ncbi:hypothetical protein PHYBOEH_010865 [Phytophthora boehmeriae]|uniref:Uncharacterized protein n=1 Tax=Phytophthora boehmeriae TaxID=109152 RepID=A0A8T1VK50_9STRA|nr:hypothetical protein PHYBOEH_010865 [Phytophthora boehmeriae]
MAKKKSKKVSAGVDGDAQVSTSGGENISELFTAMQEKGAAWYDRERAGIALIEGFQSALVALRTAQSAAVEAQETGNADGALCGLAGNSEMDPWLAEDLYQQLQELPSAFEELLEDMYRLQLQAREIVRGRVRDDEAPFDAIKLAPIDYFQMINQELATFEAEYQHVEALLRLISFETSTDELRTLVISWSTSPFLDPAQSRAFLQV